MPHSVRRNVAHLSGAERASFVAAVKQIDLLSYSDGVSYWDKQDQIHQATHSHGGPNFIPWHREICNRFEKLIQQVDPDLALHYWDWTEDPRAASDGQGGTVDLMTDTFFGTGSGMVAGVLAPLHNQGNIAGSRDATGNPANPPQSIIRNLNAGAPGSPSDNSLITGSAGQPQSTQWLSFRTAVEGAHDSVHGFFGPGSNIRNAHRSFEDPFVFLLHSNVDRLFAQWQTQPGFEWRLDPNQVYGDESSTTGTDGILDSLAPWDGTADTGAPIHPWTAGSTEISLKNSRDPSIVRPPCYDTLPLTVSQVAPAAPNPIRFIDAVENEQTVRALRLRVLGCRRVTCNATLAGDGVYSLRQASVLSPDPQAFEVHDALVWVLLDAGAAGTTPAATLTVTVPETGNVFTVQIEASVVAKPTVASALVLDQSGSMDAPSGVATLTRMQVLRNSAPLFVHLLDDADGIGIVRFDTDASVAQGIQVAGGQIGGVGRSNALAAISAHTTNPAGLTAIGDGIAAAATELAGTTGFMEKATVVFTDGHETASQYIADVAHLIGSRLFAVGLGTAEQLNPGALQDVADGTGGFLMLTGNPGPDDQILLQKYFAQILAGVTNAEIVVDPDGFVRVGDKTVVPFDVTEADRRCDVIALSPHADVIEMAVEASDGTLLTDGSGATGVRMPGYQALRVPVSPAGPGAWRVILTVDRSRFSRLLRELEERKLLAELERARVHGVFFTLTIQSRSTLRMKVATEQTSRRPGSIAQLAVTLNQSGIPLASMAAVSAEITAPNGAVSTQPLNDLSEGLYSLAIPTPTAGVYRILVRGHGTTLRGLPFTREALRTLGVWTRGDVRDPSSGPTGGAGSGLDVCGLLTCLVDNGAVKEAAKRAGIDLAAARECLERYCGG
ncbi:hypothetical protein GGE65_004918 [Skermanella aerolata]|uniref:tyrosinase family protein n=1 Tax=Skermanella aerolata TaxID=393310 RepID=UPI003D220E6A